MNYTESIEYIHNTLKFARELGNDLLRRLLHKLGNPQNDLKFIHIAGTNGKGSAAIMLAEILACEGYKTGLFTSPYIERFNERIKVNGKQIPDGRLARITTKVKKIIEEFDTPVSEFALDTAIAFLYFKESGCDYVVLEVGLGGRLDATNVIDNSIVSVIMSIGMDHTQYLGDTLSKIAEEKCGIIKQGGKVVVYPVQEDEVKEVIERVGKERKAEIIYADMPVILKGTAFKYRDKRYKLKLNGEFQKYNAVTVLCAVEALKNSGIALSDTAVESGLKKAFNPARIEKTQSGLYIDGAHNLPAVKALCDTLKALNKPISLCVAMMEDKDIDGCIKELATIKPDVFVTQLDIPRCATAERMKAAFEKYGVLAHIVKNPIEAAEKALSDAGEDGVACVCGSLYLAGAVRRHFAEKPYYVYILRCTDGSLYTGITTDVARRFAEHKGEKEGGAKYTRTRGAVAVEAVFEARGRAEASKIERCIKTLSKDKKEELIRENNKE